MRCAWLFAIVLVIAASLAPRDSRTKQVLDSIEISDIVEHFLAYAVLAFLPAIHESRRFVAVAAVGAIALGIGLEYAQLYFGTRDFEYGDMVADAAGVFFGLVVGAIVRSAWAGAKRLPHH